MNVRSAKEIKRSLLKKAIKEGRGPEMILLIQWRNALTRHKAKRRLEEFLKFECENMGQPRAVRMLNMLAGLDGSDLRFSDAQLALLNNFSSDTVN